MSKEIMIEVRDLRKSFRLPNEKASGLKQALINLTKGVRGYTRRKVLKGISFEVERGDFFGIVGRNGAGKSTLLKLLAQTYIPDSGFIKINGSLVPFIELGVGFNPELTGRENVYLNGALLGFSNAEVDTMYDEIVDFAELREFMDQKLKNYSSGMQVRLAFSIAIRAQGDILVLDEVLAVGDEAFQRKCFAYFAKLKKENKTVVLVTHSMDQVQQFCNKAILISDGQIVKSGNPAKVAQTYRELNTKSTKTSSEHNSNSEGVSARVDFKNEDDFLAFNIQFKPKKDLAEVAVLFTILRDTGEPVYRIATDERLGKHISLAANHENKMHVKVQNVFPNGVFDGSIRIFVFDKGVHTGEIIDIYDAIQFEIVSKNALKHDVLWKPNDSIEFDNQ